MNFNDLFARMYAPVMRHELDLTINGDGIFRPREVIVDVDALSDDEVWRIWTEAMKDLEAD